MNREYIDWQRIYEQGVYGLTRIYRLTGSIWIDREYMD